jgi:RES domain-containing protein
MRVKKQKIPTISLRNRGVWRCLPKAFEMTALESGPSFTKDRRYSIQGEFGAIYLSASKALSQREAGERGGEDLETLAYPSFELTLNKLVDLTSRKTRSHFGVSLEDLVRSRISKNRYEITQKLARRIYANQLNGIIAPSVYDPRGEQPGWFNVVLYPAQILRICLRRI